MAIFVGGCSLLKGKSFLSGICFKINKIFDLSENSNGIYSLDVNTNDVIWDDIDEIEDDVRPVIVEPPKKIKLKIKSSKN